MWFKKKSRAEIIDLKISDMLHELLILDFSNKEIALIINSLKEQGKMTLENRRSSLDEELKQTVNAINSL